MKQRIEAFIGLGSNLDNPEQHIKNARQAITELSDIQIIACSPLYRSKPIGPSDQPDYINAVMRIKTCLSAMDLLTELQKIENAHGRVRTIRWGARTLDLDILLYGEQTINEANLIVPHIEIPNRAFVLYPLADIADPDLQIPGHGQLSQLLTACPLAGIEKIAS